MAATHVGQYWLNGVTVDVWRVTLTGQTSVDVNTKLGNVLWCDQPIKEPTEGAVPFYEAYAKRDGSSRSGSIVVWCSDTAVTDTVVVKAYGTN